MPLSSEQILHPEKYFDYETPVKVALPELRTMLGTGWKRIDYDVNGEWSLYLILDQFLNASAESRRAAAGWAGDRYALYEGSKPGDVFFAQLTAWDTQNDAREFFDAYAKRTWRRYPNAKATEITSGDDIKAVNATAQIPVRERHDWQTNEGRVVVELQGSRVLIMEGIPGNADTKALSKASWQ